MTGKGWKNGKESCKKGEPLDNARIRGTQPVRGGRIRICISTSVSDHGFCKYSFENIKVVACARCVAHACEGAYI